MNTLAGSNRTARQLLVALLALLVCACASKLTGGMEEKGSVAHAATTPLRDIGLFKPEIPDALRGMHYPYAVATPPANCVQLAEEIKALDSLLGEENYQPQAQRSITHRAGAEAEDYALSSITNAAADTIPYRAWVRRLSGANSAERKAATAYLFGEQRRTFLRGYAAGRGCELPLPAPPTPSKPKESVDASTSSR